MNQPDQYNQPSPEFPYIYEDEEDDEPFDWSKYISRLLLYWKKIVIITGIFGFIGIVVALVQDRKYTVNITLAPEAQNGNNATSTLGGIASMFGVNMGTSSDALNISLFPDICKSTPFLAQLFDVKLTEYVAPKDAKLGVVGNQTTLFLHMTGKDKPQGFISKMIDSVFGESDSDDGDSINISQLTNVQHKVIDKLKKSIAANVDKKTGIATISVTMDDRLMATELADTVASRLQHYIDLYRTQKERENLEYYSKLADEAHVKLVQAQAAYAASMDYDRDVSLLSVSNRKDRLQQEADLANQIYSQMAQQREMARAKVQEMRPVFAVIEPASMPRIPSNSRKNTVLIFGFLGFALSAGWYIYLKGFLDDTIKMIKDKIKETKESQNIKA